MKKQYIVTLHTDVIINQKGATEGMQSSLDFIPGNNFLGIAASVYNDLDMDEQLDVFHSSKVKFSDAHPCRLNAGNRLERSFRIPASIFYPKLKSASEICFIHHFYNREKDNDKHQLKQCRNGFFIKKDNLLKEVDVNKNFAIKSAYDIINRRSMDEQMYGYQSIQAGSKFCFEVDFDESLSKDLIEKIHYSLIGRKRVGRSSTAQYGLIDIKPGEFDCLKSSYEAFSIDGKDRYCAVYAESRLIFLDKYGEPVFTPEASDFGISDGEIVWIKSQIRTFQYAPWNNQRQSRDADRCGIEKGSVFVIKLKSDNFSVKDYVGSYNNEGFGKVIVNPYFLNSDGANGEAVYLLAKNEKEKANPQVTASGKLSVLDNTLLIKLNNLREQEFLQDQIFKRVDIFIEKNLIKFRKGISSSQWGSIRSIAMKAENNETLWNDLFYKSSAEKVSSENNGNRKKSVDEGYLVHGIAKDVWNEKGRLGLLEGFIKESGETACQAVINLASEMAKRTK